MGETDDTPRYDKRIHALVSERQHKDWKSLTQGDEAPYESMSQLVRLSVQREIADENPAKGSEGGISGELQDTILDMADTLEGIDSRLSSVEKRMSKLEVGSDEDALDLQGRILNVLPTDKAEDKNRPDEWAMTIQDVVKVVGANEDTVEQVLDQLSEETGTVQRKYGGEPARKWYWRRA